MRYHPLTMTDRDGCAPHIVRHMWGTNYEIRTAAGATVASTYNGEAYARKVAAMLDRETQDAETIARGETPEPVPAVVTGANIPDHTEPNYPPQWEHTGPPSVVIIDAANPDHWQRYVWQHAAGSPVDRYAMLEECPQDISHGYRTGYYPVDMSDPVAHEMIPDGPYCAACIDPHNGFTQVDQTAPAEYPQGYYAELITEGGEDNEGNPIPRYCAGCHEPLYDPSEED